MPLMMMAARPMSSSGVSTLPTMSTTADSRMHSARMSAKNSTENTTADTPGRFGAMAISNVLADVRGMATMGPTHRMIAHMRISDGTRPTRWSTASPLPTRSSANMAASASPMSAIKYALNPASHCGPDSMPRYGGKITFPAPKNMENSAKPTTIMSRAARFFVSFMFSLLLPSGRGRQLSISKYSVSFFLINEKRELFMGI